MKTKKKSGKTLRKSGKSQGKIREFDGIKKVGTLIRANGCISLYCRFSAGLFPLLGYAAMNVKPVLLALYEVHFVPLGHYIKPGLTGLLLGLLPGLEEGSEFYER